MFEKLKGKALIGILAVAYAVLLETTVTLAKKLMNKTARQEVVDGIIKENEEKAETGESNRDDGIESEMDENNGLG